MNINQHSFANNPVGVERPRSTFARNSTHRTTLNAGGLVPFYLDEVLPGDTFDVSTSLVCRMTTPITPVMDDCYLDVYYFFVPHRLVWDHWKEFNGENTDSAWVSDVEYIVPNLIFSTYDIQEYNVGSIFDYLGLPINRTNATNEFYENNISALPYRSYKLVWNEWFRDQNLQDPVFINKSDSADNVSFNDYSANYVPNLGVLPVCKFHDYFTSALPGPLKSRDPVKVPIGNVPIVTGPDNPNISASNSGLDALRFEFTNNMVQASNGVHLRATHPGVGDDNVGSTVGWAELDGAGTSVGWAVPKNLYTDNGGVISVNDLRLAFQTQRYYEALARGGSRYNEIILSLFGVHVPDATVQRPEYLGGQRVNIRLNEVVQQSMSYDGSDGFSPLGTVAAYSKTTDRSHSFVKSFSEHGYVLGVCCIRPNHSYSNGINKLWTRKNRFDFYIPQFAHLGEQPIYNYEIYNSLTPNLYDTNVGFINEVFGYQEAWAEYRFKPSTNSGYFRPGVPNGLSYWHYGDFYTSQPVLSAEWIAETPNNIDRTLAIDSAEVHQFWIDFYVENNTTRVMPMYSVPGLIDHF